MVGKGTLMTSTLKVHWAVPHAFDATHVTENEPRGSTVPNGGLQVTLAVTGDTVGAG